MASNAAQLFLPLFGLLDTFSHLFFFPFLPPLWSASWIEPKPPTPSLFSLSLTSSRLSSYIILHQYVYLRSRAPHHCLCQTTENEMGRTTKKKTKKKKLSQLCLRIVRYKCTYCHPVREGLHYNLRKIRTPKMQVEMRTMGSSLLKIEIVIIGTNLMRQNVLLVSANILTNRSDPPRMNRGLVCKHVAWLRRDWVREWTRLLPARSRTPGVLWGICTWLERFNLMPFLLSPPWLRGLSVHF